MYYYFRKWKKDWIFEEVHDLLVDKVRIGKVKASAPSAGIMDSQSIKACNLCKGDVGNDGSKKILGRKRHIGIDILGLIMITGIQLPIFMIALEQEKQCER